MKKKTHGGHAAPALDERFALVVEAFAADAGTTLGRMFGAPGLKVGGKVFAMLVKGRLVVKLPRARVDALVAAGTAEHFDPGHGRLMQEWASVGAEAGADWVALAREANAHVAGPH